MSNSYPWQFINAAAEEAALKERARAIVHKDAVFRHWLEYEVTYPLELFYSVAAWDNKGHAAFRDLHGHFIVADVDEMLIPCGKIQFFSTEEKAQEEFYKRSH